MDIAILIPAYKPSGKLVGFVKGLASQAGKDVVVIDDGGGASFKPVFDELRNIPRVTVLTHGQNRGKGAALKTGFAHLRERADRYAGVVTADADGQHLTDDIVRVAEALKRDPGALVLGVRSFSGDVPLRSKVGNQLTIRIFKLFYGVRVSDTQTGLRGIPASLLPALGAIPYDRYEYETEMLILCSRRKAKILEVPIATVYEDNNSSSHFSPLTDSLKIYYVILRYTLAALLSALVDYVVFVSAYPLIGNILFSTYAARAVSLCVNYGLVSKKVFASDKKMRETFPKYLLLVIVSGALSSLIIYLMHRYAGVPVYLAKIVAETILYVFNFFVQKRLIFKDAGPEIPA